VTASTIPPYTYGRADEPPFVLPDNVELRPNLVYATAFGQEWLLDLFLPRTRLDGAPGVVFLRDGVASDTGLPPSPRGGGRDDLNSNGARS